MTSRPLRACSALAILALLSACAGHRQLSNSQEAADYARHARRDYRPPGPADDPWGPYISEASARFDVPERWIREVMRAESGGRLYEHGELITSPTGAMGLMQVEPGTFDELKARYSLDDDPYEPRNNLFAGTAYIREMYDIYGSPGFLAAYNAGPGRLDDYLTRGRTLPLETRNYMAKIGPYIADSQPQKISPASELAINQIPYDIPSGPRYPRHGQPVALAENRYRRGSSRLYAGVTTRSVLARSSAPEPPAPLYAAASLPSRRSFRLISSAMADTLPQRQGRGGSGNWAIQVGAFGSESQARAAAGAARIQVASAQPFVGQVRQGRGVLYRARLQGMSRDSAIQACQRLHGRGCIVLSPEAQS